MTFEKILSRIKNETPIKNMVELASFLGTAQSNVSHKKSKNTFPTDWAYKVGKKYNLLTEWIMEGTGPMRPGTQFRREKEVITDIEEWLNEITKEDPDAEEWFKFEMKRKIPEFKEWLKKRDSGGQYLVPQKKTA